MPRICQDHGQGKRRRAALGIEKWTKPAANASKRKSIHAKTLQAVVLSRSGIHATSWKAFVELCRGLSGQPHEQPLLGARRPFDFLLIHCAIAQLAWRSRARSKRYWTFRLLRARLLRLRD